MQQRTRTSMCAGAVAGALAAMCLAGSAFAMDLEASKVRMVERYGLSAADPDVASRIAQAHAIRQVTVREDAAGVAIIIDVVGAPEYRGVIFAERRRYVFDLFNTLNVADSGPWDLGPDSPIRAVRHSQFQVQPDYIGRIVCDLAPGVEPTVTAAEGQFTIFVPADARLEPIIVAHAPNTLMTHDATVTDLPVLEPVLLDPLAVDDLGPPMAEPAFATAEDAPPAAPAADMGDESAIAVTPWWMAIDELEDDPAMPEDTIAQETPGELAEDATMPEDASVQETPVAPVAGDEGATPATDDVVDDVVEVDEPAAEDTPWWVQVEQATSDGLSERYDVAQADPLEDSLMEPPFGEEVFPAATDEPARIEVDETIETPSMPTLPEPDLPEIEPTVIEVEAPGPPLLPEVEPEPLAPGPFEPEPFFLDEPGPQVETIVPVAAVEPIMTTKFGPSPMEQMVTLTFRDADLNAVLDIIARKGRINVLAGRDVSGTVTVRLTDVPLDVALDAVLNVNGYGYIKTHNIYRIVPLSQIGGDDVETVTETFELSYAVAADVEGTLTSFLTRNGSINTDNRTNLLIVTDVPQAVSRIAALIPQIDRRVQQVLIEVVILDSVLSDSSDLGVQWNLFQADDRTPSALGTGAPFVTGGTMSGAGATSTVATTIQDGLGVILPSASAGGPGLRLRFGTLIGDFNLSAFIEAQVVNSNARVLANPKLLTLDNTSANIDIVQEIPFQDITQTSSGGQLSNISFKEVGTKLEVTPHITNDGYVIMQIKPEQSSAIAATATGVPIVATRRAETTLLVQDRQTIVLGGLRVNSTTLTRSKVPGLGDLPGVKLLFRSTSSRETDTEILLFLTTHIIESPEVRQHERLVYDELANWPRQPETQPDLWR